LVLDGGDADSREIVRWLKVHPDTRIGGLADGVFDRCIQILPFGYGVLSVERILDGVHEESFEVREKNWSTLLKESWLTAGVEYVRMTVYTSWCEPRPNRQDGEQLMP